MKFLSFAIDNQPRLGLLTDEDQVVDLTMMLRSTPDHGLSAIPERVCDLIEAGDEAILRLQQLISEKGSARQSLQRLDEVNVLPPLRPKKNIYCVGRNYREHIIEG